MPLGDFNAIGAFGFQTKHLSGGTVCERKRGYLQKERGISNINQEMRNKAKVNKIYIHIHATLSYIYFSKMT